MEDLGDSAPVTDWASVIASAELLLDRLDEAGIIHGDLDPPNIIIQDNVLKVVDFGLAGTGSHVEDRERLMKAIRELQDGVA